MKIYTKKGDDGSTGLWGGTRVSKSSMRVSAYGEVDMLNSWLGLARTEQIGKLDTYLAVVQEELFHVGAELAADPSSDSALGITLVQNAEVEWMETIIDELESELQPLKQFILPGGTKAASVIHLARTTCRTAERAVVALAERERVRPELVHYLNRLSDLLFVMARYANYSLNVPDVAWEGRSSVK